MLAATIIAIALLAALGAALRPGRKTIVHTPYNNRHNDAVGARDGRSD
jgi:hypothetical protein